MTPDQYAELLRAATSHSIWTIVLGAALAVLGGFLAKLYEEWRNRQSRRRIVTAFACDVLDSLSTTFSELLDYQGQTGTVYINILDRILEEYPSFQRNREHIITLGDVRIRRELQSLIFKIHNTTTLLKDAVFQDQRARGLLPADPNAPPLPQGLTPEALVRHRFEQLRAQIDQARDLRQRLGPRRRVGS